ncbi:sigma-54-dependent transcriptional regulator [Chlamydiifrater phoenicopteri]|uniref:sigma-54-dependent transcriptional regulator n=1 Tax=Chlamydiifrater phoenicopteri TaxID=2681469 RepID=UPI001BCB74AA|nr:sigma-54 dependent transcriptional regulator [Chlamydiifrater phoenicopteri]
MIIESILIVDDEPILRAFLQELLESRGYAATTATNTKEARSLIRKNFFDLIISDMNMPDGSGLDVLSEAQKYSPETPVLVITAFGTIENAVEAMQKGAFNYLTKPFSSEALLAYIDKAKEHKALLSQNSFFKSEASSNSEYPLIAESLEMKNLLLQAKKIARTNANVFVHGESGCGKEVISQYIHNNSLRSQGPYIKVNCAAIPEPLMESEFFGHEKGAFTGATIKKAGRFELANKGTLLLDEITEVPINLQPKLLRAIQEREFEHLGGTKTISVDVRILATSNRNLREALEDKSFRKDLYYRLNVVSIHIPPLRERKADIMPLTNFFLNKFCKMNGKKIKALSSESKESLLDYHWPGNVRELSNVIERAVILENTETILLESLSLN